MAKLKAKRTNISLDMTAMCDMAFLLLTFFILTAKMKTPEPANFDVPASVSVTKLPETEVLRISISNDGRAFFTIAEQSTRRSVISTYCNNYKLQLSELQKQKFELMETWGMPSKDLPVYLNLPEASKKNFPQRGIPVDSINNELKQWVATAVTVNPNLRIALKGDKNTSYKDFQQVVDAMRQMGLSNFSLITNLESKPTEL
ncbi:MAG: biopolymer transporter ExbD [Cytophagaceae bacterium]|jgi:biopolymer transport protein ExbD|nr:biopolymer transporter ExbD [Cytophagaceae bacterium]